MHKRCTSSYLASSTPPATGWIAGRACTDARAVRESAGVRGDAGPVERPVRVPKPAFRIVRHEDAGTGCRLPSGTNRLPMGNAGNCLRWSVRAGGELMPGEVRRSPSSLAAKLDKLFQAVRPGGRGEYSYQEVADAIRGGGGPTISATYLWQLRKGLRDNPTRNHLAALARFFGVSPAYFFDEDAAEVVDAQLSLLAAMRDASVRSVALRAAGLSVESLAAVQVVIDHARRLEGLEPDTEPDPGPTAEPRPGLAREAGDQSAGEAS